MVERFFTEDDLPPGDPNLSGEGSARNFGWSVKFDVAGTVTGLSIYGPATSPPTPRAKFFLEADESLLAFKDYAAPIAASAWNDILFDAPVVVEPDVNYVPAFWMQGSANYAHTGGFLDGSDVVRGHMTAIADNGRFFSSDDPDAFPFQLWTGIFYVDVLFEPEDEGGDGEGGTGVGWQRKVNRHCTYLQQKTVNGNTNYVKRRPAVITALGAGELVNLRVRHIGETYANVDRKFDPDANTVGVYVTY